MSKLSAFFISLLIFFTSINSLALAQSEEDKHLSTFTTAENSSEIITPVPISMTATISSATISAFQKGYSNTLISVVSILHFSSCMIIGEKCLGNAISPISYTQSLSKNSEKSSSLFKDGMLGMTSNLITITYTNPPASFSYALGSLFQTINPAAPIYAQNQGIGLSSLSTFSTFWSVNRNISYALTIFVLIIVGFLLIFQYKLDPHTSIDLEKVLLRIVLVIIVITFSFAIAGLLLDLMYLFIFALSYIAKQNNLIAANTIDTIFTNANPESLFSFLFSQGNVSGVVESLQKLIPQAMMYQIHNILWFLTFLQVAPFFANSIANLIQTPILSLAGALGGTLLAGVLTAPIVDSLISFFLSSMIGLTLLFLYFRILFLLISSYIEIVIETIFAPYFLLADILPGKSGLSSWLRRYIANMIAFPLVFILFLTGATINRAFSLVGVTLLPPPLISFDQTIIANIISIGILLSIPGIVDRVKRAIHPQPMLVNFPQTPAALLSTAATILPFIPHIISSATQTVTSGIPRRMPKSGEQGSEKPTAPDIPHIPQ